jgi:hypothetical protein
MGYDGKLIGKRSQVILSPIFITKRVKHEVPGFSGRMKNTMTMKTTFVKDKDTSKFSFSLEERESTNGDGSPLPPHISCGVFKE